MNTKINKLDKDRDEFMDELLGPENDSDLNSKKDFDYESESAAFDDDLKDDLIEDRKNPLKIIIAAVAVSLIAAAIILSTTTTSQSHHLSASEIKADVIELERLDHVEVKKALVLAPLPESFKDIKPLRPLELSKPEEHRISDWEFFGKMSAVFFIGLFGIFTILFMSRIFMYALTRIFPLTYKLSA